MDYVRARKKFMESAGALWSRPGGRLLDAGALDRGVQAVWEDLREQAVEAFGSADVDLVLVADGLKAKAESAEARVAAATQELQAATLKADALAALVPVELGGTLVEGPKDEMTLNGAEAGVK